MLLAENQHNHWMHQALCQARRALEFDEVPVGAIVVKDQKIVGQGYNQPIRLHDPSAHAEIQALRDAARNLSNYRLEGCSLYVTIEPCTMCFGALIHARIDHLIFGAREPKAGAVISHPIVNQHQGYNHQLNIQHGVLDQQCRELIQDFFKQKRQSTRSNR